MRSSTMTPDGVPVLSAGRHRNPRKGACFMEMASFLAGEKWSDHPSCTHPLLAGLARMVNDSLPDSERGRIARLIPDVVGVTGTSVDLDISITVHAAAAALPVAAAERQNVMACALVTCERLMADRGIVDPHLAGVIREARVRAPAAVAWAQKHTPSAPVADNVFRRRTAPQVVRYAVEGIASACTDDRADRLVLLLTDTISDVSARVVRHEPAAPVATPAPAPARAGRASLWT